MGPYADFFIIIGCQTRVTLSHMLLVKSLPVKVFQKNPLVFIRIGTEGEKTGHIYPPG
jgi:hypothetical protein